MERKSQQTLQKCMWTMNKKLPMWIIEQLGSLHTSFLSIANMDTLVKEIGLELRPVLLIVSEKNGLKKMEIILAIIALEYYIVLWMNYFDSEVFCTLQDLDIQMEIHTCTFHIYKIQDTLVLSQQSSNCIQDILYLSCLQELIYSILQQINNKWIIFKCKLHKGKWQSCVAQSGSTCYFPISSFLSCRLTIVFSNKPLQNRSLRCR